MSISFIGWTLPEGGGWMELNEEHDPCTLTNPSRKNVPEVTSSTNIAPVQTK